LRVRVALAPREIEVLVEDDGTGMMPRTDSPGLGLGLPLIANLANRFDIHTTDSGGTRVCMWFSIDPGLATLPA
jgi:anti-sigma regulatory factor (Ser/Thr protein kinase)